MKKVAVIGATGYTGGELLRLLVQHPGVQISAVTSERSTGQTIDRLFPNLVGRLSLELEPMDFGALSDRADLFFLALPHTMSMEAVAFFVQAGKSVIDLSADFRLRDPNQYVAWYGKPHLNPDLLPKAVYGLPEIHREAVRKARLVANPGCYPTGALLGLLPLIAENRIENDSIVVDSKSGISGAGRSPAKDYHFPEANESLSAYKIGKHRHIPEIEQELSGMAKSPVEISFTPHLIPMTRGILSTIYVRTIKPVETGEVLEHFRKFYQNEPFIQVLPEGLLPDVSHVRGSNDCHIGLSVDGHRSGNRNVTIVTAIDNLVKGAAGQAIQNMNLMVGFEETLGLNAPGLFP